MFGRSFDGLIAARSLVHTNDNCFANLALKHFFAMCLFHKASCCGRSKPHFPLKLEADLLAKNK
jgi:hypothetical protein